LKKKRPLGLPERPFFHAQFCLQLVSSRMAVAPIPIIALFLAIQPVVLPPLVVPFSQPHVVRANFAVIPAMVIGVIFVVITYARCATTSSQRRKHGSSKQQGPEKAVHAKHLSILLKFSR
jgi:hypothetical protein